MVPKTNQNPSKIGPGSYQNGVSKTERKNVSKNIEKCRKWTPKWGPILGHILAIWPLFAVPGRPWEPKRFPRPPQEPPGPVQASIFTDFGSILSVFFDDFSCHVDYFLLVCLVFFLVTLNPILQNLGHKFKLFGVASRVISALRSALRGTVSGRPKASGYLANLKAPSHYLR